ncbi:Uma2 family endonuclease [Leptothoe spongobia]|uniref:Uma2 family endonuclease n=1 Tax=Leptothoe spongobia TAU-MAC 1115 TaxID=1967444 RepID=A0A947GKS8_9CYAN|nr:Uma2 family endonuclease [Leptothoe spongobia]MBT9317754.1 Uma2 family endonuclease [Leptothoe spongobia TAU-MAC 1115]
MTYTPVRYKTYLQYLDADLSPDGNLRLLSNGEVIELPPEDAENDFIADELAEFLKKFVNNRRLVRSSSTEIQVHPIGDNRVNRKPDVIVLQPEHLDLMTDLKKNAILFDMPAPRFVAEVVSPGSESSANYRRDYEWKRQQYEWWQVLEYWIIDRHRQQIVVCTLINDVYEENCYRNSDIIQSWVFPTLKLVTDKLLTGELFL